jgi:hypothetical protein
LALDFFVGKMVMVKLAQSRGSSVAVLMVALISSIVSPG